MSEAEVHALFDRMLPGGFAGQDVLDEIAPEGWERSPLLACFHPSVERVYEERVSMHRNLEELRRLRRRRDGSAPRLRDELEGANARARKKAMDRKPPAAVRAHRQVYGRDPRGWPPA